MSIIKWLKDRKIFKLKQELVGLEQKVKVWENCTHDPDGVPVFVIQKVARLRARVAQIKEALK